MECFVSRSITRSIRVLRLIKFSKRSLGIGEILGEILARFIIINTYVSMVFYSKRIDEIKFKNFILEYSYQCKSSRFSQKILRIRRENSFNEG